MKLLFTLLLATASLYAAGKHYVVCIVAGEDTACTKPLSKDAAEAVFQVFSKAPIAGMDAVYLADTRKTKKPKQQLPPEPRPAPTTHPQVDELKL
ncbi:MAG: hypothetical protein V4522_13180 [Pseudomonadota bacterium]